MAMAGHREWSALCLKEFKGTKRERGLTSKKKEK